jgi:hypothetical protein
LPPDIRPGSSHVESRLLKLRLLANLWSSLLDTDPVHSAIATVVAPIFHTVSAIVTPVITAVFDTVTPVVAPIIVSIPAIATIPHDITVAILTVVA